MAGPFDQIRTKPLLDRMGKPVGEKDLVYLMGKTDAMWQIHTIEPILDPDPTIPPGAVKVSLISHEVIVVMPRQQIGGMLLTLSVEQQERLQKQVSAMQGAPQAEGTKQ